MGMHFELLSRMKPFLHSHGGEPHIRGHGVPSGFSHDGWQESSRAQARYFSSESQVLGMGSGTNRYDQKTASVYKIHTLGMASGEGHEHHDRRRCPRCNHCRRGREGVSCRWIDTMCVLGHIETVNLYRSSCPWERARSKNLICYVIKRLYRWLLNANGKIRWDAVYENDHWAGKNWKNLEEANNDILFHCFSSFTSRCLSDTHSCFYFQGKVTIFSHVLMSASRIIHHSNQTSSKDFFKDLTTSRAKWE